MRPEPPNSPFTSKPSAGPASLPRVAHHAAQAAGGEHLHGLTLRGLGVGANAAEESGRRRECGQPHHPSLPQKLTSRLTWKVRGGAI